MNVTVNSNSGTMRQGHSHAPKLPSSRMHSACHAIGAAMNAGVAKDAIAPDAVNPLRG